jgi:hypothetical protein
VQPVASRYTDCAIPTPDECQYCVLNEAISDSLYIIYNSLFTDQPMSQSQSKKRYFIKNEPFEGMTYSYKENMDTKNSVHNTTYIKEIVRFTFGVRAERIFNLCARWSRIQLHAPFDKKVNESECSS